MDKTKLFHKDFTLVVIGQIISLFGNGILRFALPLYLLNETGSAALFGMVSALSFIPMIIMSSIGGIVADRRNKRNIMVVLDFSTATLVLCFALLRNKVDLVSLLIVTMCILYGIQGAYQPSVQASVPLLVSVENNMSANAIINLVNSLAAFVGPVVGGSLFSFLGIAPLLYISMTCFFFSAVMELFIKIPFTPVKAEGNMFKIAFNDMKSSLHFATKENAIIGRISGIIATIYMFCATLIVIGIPVIITQRLGFPEALGNRLYGYTQGAMALGGLLGGGLVSMLGSKLDVRKSYYILLCGCAGMIPIGIVLMLDLPAFTAYAIITLSCFLLIFISSMVTIELMSCVQIITPTNLVGKVMSFVVCITYIAQPIGQGIYGVLIEYFPHHICYMFFGATAICVAVTLASSKIFKSIPTAKQLARKG